MYFQFSRFISKISASSLILSLSLGLSLVLSLSACNRPSEVVDPANSVAAMQSTDLIVGTGVAAESGKQVTVHYTGWLYDAKAPGQRGQQFDSSVTRGTPFSFQLGDGQVIKGWDQGVLGMKVGGHRNLIIPSDLAYGPRGRGPIPPAATLVFDIQLIAVN
ncbi:FKBP-type peptidyl-prolyl cis-trans isomerase [Undibacterium baiyunense]|uniref:Peptidyl-prolyl cis-trans isomerase n=1 Tax=Undibacterium baiyunense TaxID=2828731 RepID=A0A941DGY8_9BURK|nr:FKBP-type peptidyl-prolyl cis-trans isomerase [Undibacterium baiyunense]MBR7747910.1 FKBP-type peptidyl-prolyl cis-trans isomerase [Undibacterium baiyunense]